MKKVSLVALSVVLAFTMLFALTACSKSDEQIIKDALTEDLADFKTRLTSLDSELWQVALKELSSGFESLGVNLNDLATAWAEGFSYEIGAVKVDGDSASVEVVITCKQLSPAIVSASELMSNDPEAAGRSVSENQKKLGETILSELRKSTPKSATISITYTKSDKTWIPSTSSMMDLAQALIG